MRRTLSRELSGCVICAMVVANSSYAAAGGLVITSGSPRAIGRAGTGTVGDDGGGALLVNPAALARREGIRGQLGMSFTDDEIAWRGRAAAPIVRNQSASDIAPTASAMGSIGPWVIAAGAMTAAVSQRALRPPSPFPPSQLGIDFDFRYTGISGGIQRDTFTIGIARRIGDTLAVGLAIAGSRVTVSESRRVWAGFGPDRDRIGDPEFDVDVLLDGADRFVPSLVAGILLAPADDPIELGASIGWSQGISVDANADAFTFGTARGPRITKMKPSATIELPQPITVRVGARYLGERVVAELGGDLWYAPAGSAESVWSVAGIRVVDQSDFAADLFRVPSRISLRTHGAVRGAADIELIGGFLWATLGYAYTIGGVAGERQSPTFGDLGGHTAAAGLEVTTGGFTFTLGWSRTWSVKRHPGTALQLDNPLLAGDALVPTGNYDGSIDQIGILLDAELDAPD